MKSSSPWSFDFEQRARHRGRCRESTTSERTKIIKSTVDDSPHDLSSIGMQAPSISHRDTLPSTLRQSDATKANLKDQARSPAAICYDRKISVPILLFHQFVNNNNSR